MAPSGLVIALNEDDQVLAIDTPDVLLQHVVSHLSTATPAAEVANPSLIQFFDEGGTELTVVITNAWHEVAFVPTGEHTDLQVLRQRMERIVDRRIAAIAQQSSPPQVKKPRGGTWPQYLQSCADLVNGRQRQSPTSQPDPFDRRGWWHNTFVHGGNP